MTRRISLANFLEKLATVGVSREDWKHYLVTHYPEDLLEEARRATVKLTLNTPFDKSESHHHRLKLQANDSELRKQIQAIASTLLNPEQAV
jgi:hypothetical protein